MGRSTVHYADNKTNNALKRLHNKLRPAGTPVQRVEYIIELLLLRIFETKIKQDEEFKPLRKLFSPEYKWRNPKTGKEETNENRLFSYLATVSNDQILAELNNNFFPFYENLLQSARQVYEGNLPQKVQDQLVLIEEVFGNSNFTNNVNSGNLGEVISIVTNDIEDERLLKTDLLGDAIESSLSETGGTKDIGLFRTPDHIRQFMTALVEPGIDDFVFDPACGTGGFLFDAFEFVMRRIDPDQTWPGEKTHKELQQWFDQYFTYNQLDFPSIEQSTQFYRSGVAGIEYLGMIRKMAAINFYIRGLNPANIEQGDSLAKYSPVTDAESKTVILANPPFGAERDQEAYPDVWPEYAKESETTILFVKLMVELLKKGGRAAVVVSEGFHTWDQFSAKALRKLLLDENQLKAVISLPQGLFVSKSGQGPKTSILLFEKGGATDWVWFYKVTNDGYTMGTNRKEQPGCQLVECLTLYHEYVKHGKQPPETKHQFCIPAEWIKTLDPRIKDKIRQETRTELAAKGTIERAKKEAEYDRKIKACKLSELEKSIQLKQFDQILENKIQNEIAKRIDKAHLYSFNLSNYKSNLSENQVQDWRTALEAIQPNGVATVEEAYKKLKSATPDKAATYIARLNPTNALESDIVREYVSNLDANVVAEHQELYTLRELLKSGASYPKVKLGALITLQRGSITVEEESLYKRVTCKLNGQGVFLRDKVLGQDVKTKQQQVLKKNQLLVAEIDAKFGGYGIVPEACEGAIVSSHYYIYNINQAELLPEFLGALLQSPQVLEQVKTFVKGTTSYAAIRSGDFLEIDIPLPNLDEQAEIVAQIDKQKALIEGAEKVLDNWEITEVSFTRDDTQFRNLQIDNFAIVGTGSTPSREDNAYFSGDINWVLTSEVAMNEIVETSEKLSEKAITDYALKIYPENTILVAMYGQGKTRGQSSLLKVPAAITQNCAGIIVNEEIALPKYVWYYLMSIYEKIRGQDYSGGGVPHLNLKIVKSIRVPLPDLETQHQIVAELDAQIQVLDGLRKMKAAAETKIESLLSTVWGVVHGLGRCPRTSPCPT
ncbi:hypothetical protein GCM10023189_46240 [Nibrella saemangeumensis]|uniref:site-specific DNA-methyltransferase (adenine-specific) n=1 Tax=Nibrella saemangeumensis TaxID=1084526 RepID=A0ABP8NHH8_9BACT